jgi:hypothetical protein
MYTLFISKYSLRKLRKTKQKSSDIPHWYSIQGISGYERRTTSEPEHIFPVLVRGSFAKFVDSPYYFESELCGGAVTVSFRSTSLDKRCTSYNAPPTSRNHAADR